MVYEEEVVKTLKKLLDCFKELADGQNECVDILHKIEGRFNSLEIYQEKLCKLKKFIEEKQKKYGWVDTRSEAHELFRDILNIIEPEKALARRKSRAEILKRFGVGERGKE